MHFISEHPLDDGVLERRFILDGIPGILWTPASASAPAPLILLGHPPLGLSTMYPRLVARARHAAADGFATATIELPGSGDRPSWPALNQAREDLRRTLRAGDPVNDDLVDALVLPLVDAAAPEWRAALDAVLALPEITGPVGISGGLISLAVRLTVTDPRIKAAGLFAGSFAPARRSRRPAASRSRCTSSSSGTTRATTATRPWPCSTPSPRRTSPSTPTWAATRASQPPQRTRRRASSGGI